MRVLLILLLMACALCADSCPGCRLEMEREWRYCPRCGRPVAEVVARDATAVARRTRDELIDAVRKLRVAEKESGNSWRDGELEDFLWRIADEDFSDRDAPHDELDLGVYDNLGGGRYGGRIGGRRNLVARNGGSQGLDGTEAAVRAGLRWLARHQGPEGAWSCAAFRGHCAGDKCPGNGAAEHDTGCTGLALLAFLGSGYTHRTRETYLDPHSGYETRWGDVILKGLRWLLAHQDGSGSFASLNGSKYIYDHAIATMAVAEAYGITGNVLLREPAQRGVQFLIDSQNPGKGWGYTRQCGTNDTSVTGWCVLALKAAATAGLDVGKKTFDGADAWFKEATDARDWKVGYHEAGERSVAPAGKSGDWATHENLTAETTTCLILIHHRHDTPAIEGGLGHLFADLPDPKTGSVDYCYWHWGTQAVFQADAPDGKSWKAWNDAVKSALIPLQITKARGCEAGSWDPALDPWGAEGGRIYATALNVLTLETYYRFPRVTVRRK